MKTCDTDQGLIKTQQPANRGLVCCQSPHLSMTYRLFPGCSSTFTFLQVRFCVVPLLALKKCFVITIRIISSLAHELLHFYIHSVEA